MREMNITQKASGLELTICTFSATSPPHVHSWLHYLLAVGGIRHFYSFGDESLFFVQAEAQVIQRDK
jgi:hypothetical protein